MFPATWRKQQQLSLRAVARMVGVVSATTVLRYERGEREAPNSVALAYEKTSRSLVTSEDLAHVRRSFLSARKPARRRVYRTA